MAIQVVLKAYLEIHTAHYQQSNGNDYVSLHIINSWLKMTMNEMYFTVMEWHYWLYVICNKLKYWSNYVSVSEKQNKQHLLFLKQGTKLQQDLVDDHGGPGQPIQNYFAKQSANIE